MWTRMDCLTMLPSVEAGLAVRRADHPERLAG